LAYNNLIANQLLFTLYITYYLS